MKPKGRSKFRYPRILKPAKDSVTIQLGPTCQFIVNALTAYEQIEVIGDNGSLVIRPNVSNVVRIGQTQYEDVQE